MLAWVSKVLRVDSSGIDYSEVGINRCKGLFEALNLKIDLHHTNFFEHSLPIASFDFVTSFGFIEHFDNPKVAVKYHIDLLKPGGMALITIPNYGGIYGKIQNGVIPRI
jgi:2-polyprenyl-3-methyl-5-hydroxy-6-metoxy-1,4-benzoquinol methylase